MTETPIDRWAPAPSCVRVELATERSSSGMDAPPKLLVGDVPVTMAEAASSPKPGDKAQPRLWTTQLHLKLGSYALRIRYEYDGKTSRENARLDAEQQQPWDSCKTFRIDLTPKKAVALIPMDPSATCGNAGIDRAVFNNMVRTALKPTVEAAGRVWRDYETWQKTLAWMGELPRVLGARAATQATTSNVGNSFERFAVYRSELLSHGIREAVAAEIVCDKTDGSDGYHYTVWTTKIRVDEANRENFESMRDEDLGRILEERNGVASRKRSLPRVIRNTLRQLFAVPYILSHRQRQQLQYGEEARFRFEAYAPTGTGPRVLLEARHVSSSEADTCDQGEKALRAGWSNFKGEVRERSRFIEEGEPQIESLSFVPTATGRFAYRVSLLTQPTPASTVQPQDDRTSYYGCFHVGIAEASMWGEVLTGMPIASPGVKSVFAVNVGMRFATADTWAIGLSLGYRYRTFERSSLASWADVTEGRSTTPAVFDAEGFTRLSWSRHGFPTVVYGEYAPWSVLSIRAGVGIDLGLITTHNVSGQFRYFLGTSKPGTVIFDVDLEARLEAEFHIALGFGIVIGLQAQGFEDALLTAIDAAGRGQITVDRGVILAAGARWTPL